MSLLKSFWKWVDYEMGLDGIRPENIELDLEKGDLD